MSNHFSFFFIIFAPYPNQVIRASTICVTTPNRRLNIWRNVLKVSYARPKRIAVWFVQSCWFPTCWHRKLPAKWSNVPNVSHVVYVDAICTSASTTATRHRRLDLVICPTAARRVVSHPIIIVKWISRLLHGYSAKSPSTAASCPHSKSFSPWSVQCRIGSSHSRTNCSAKNASSSPKSTSCTRISSIKSHRRRSCNRTHTNQQTQTNTFIKCTPAPATTIHL